MSSKTPGGNSASPRKTPGGVLEHLDPATLLIETNVRADLHLDQAFLASVKEHGVLVPVIAVRTEQGVRVRAGQRRTAAAVEAGLPWIPVMVVDDTGGDADRIVQQLTENVHRTGLTDSDTVAAVEQLALLGCTAAQIVKKTRIPRPKVDQALLVADSPAREVFDSAEGMNLEMVAWLAEFDDDPDRQAHLLRCFERNPQNARHDVERARQARREEQAYTALLPTIAAQNPTAAHYTGQVWDDRKAKMLDSLVAHRGGKKTITVEEHEDCPGHAFQLVLASQYNSHPGLTQDGVGFDLRWLCTDWKANGHHDRYATHGDDKPEAGSEQARQQRRMTVELNKAGDAAKTVREEWLTQFTVNGKGGKHLPDNWHLFALDALDETHLCSEEKRDGLPHVLALLGIPNLSSYALSDKDAAHILLCTRLWTMERHATREVWRSPNVRDYLAAIGDWGYPLSPVEKAGAGMITAEQAYEQLQETS